MKVTAMIWQEILTMNSETKKLKKCDIFKYRNFIKMIKNKI